MINKIEKNNSSRPKVIITGANRGIGLSSVKKFVKNGWDICACARTKSVELNKALGNKGSTYILDLSDQSSVINCAKNIISKEKRIDEKLEVHKACKDIAQKLDNDYNDIYSIINAGIRKQQENKAFNQYEEILKVLKDKDIEELERGINYTEIYRWAWDHTDPTTVKKFIDNGTYSDETSFKNSFRTQIKQAVEKVNQNLEKNTTRPVLYVDEGKTYLTDLIFKFYITWKEKDA